MSKRISIFLEIWDYRELLYTLAWRDIKIRYKQSIMGFLWALFMPMMVILSGILVKKAFSIISGKPTTLSDIAMVMVKSLPWAFFVSAVRFSSNSLIGNQNLVTKIYFPREVLPLSAILASLFDFVIASVTLGIVLAFARVGIDIHLLWLPFLVFVLVCFVVACGLLFSCANLFFRDVKYIIEVILTFGIFFTPVFYEIEIFGEKGKFLLLNPLAVILESLKNIIVLHKNPNFIWLGYTTIFSVLFLLISWKIFHEAEFKFAENI